MNDVHVHIPAGYSGIVHLHIASDAEGEPTVELTRGDKATVEETLAKFERYDPDTNVRAFVSALRTAGWEADTHPNGKYVRMYYHGDAISPVTLLVNTRNSTNYNSATRRFAALIEGADVRPNGNVVFRFDGDEGIEPAVNAAGLLADFADGNISIAAQPAQAAS